MFGGKFVLVIRGLIFEGLIFGGLIFGGLIFGILRYATNIFLHGPRA